MLDGNGRTLKTTQTSLQILELILEHEGLSLAEFDQMIDKPKSSLHSHLNTLVDCRYLVKEEGVYKPSFRLALLGDRARQRNRLKSVAVEKIDELTAATGEEANFTVLEYGRLLMIYGSSGVTPNADDDALFRREYHLHNTAAGKALLAELDRDHVESILDEWGMPRETESTITDRERLYSSLETISDRGYAIVNEEFAPGLVAVGAVVHNDEEDVVGGLSIGGPKYRIDMSRLHDELADQLLATVAELERESPILV
ncbi:IclR family transcriptional regulator [Natrarchaeobius sp. A-rgal3]|uniref:IclR family transcriptional regulator n=1 Tax=Natrarchaeobius versutus TaxID=1679078 RepID=UPI00351023E6